MHILNISTIFVLVTKEVKMGTSRRYTISLAPSGWAVYDEHTNKKVASFGCRNAGRLNALEKMYQLNGWNIPKDGFR